MNNYIGVSTLLDIAVILGRVDCIKVLIDAGASVDISRYTKPQNSGAYQRIKKNKNKNLYI